MFWGAKNFFKFFKKYFSNRIEKLHKMAFIYLFIFLKKFEKFEKTGIISTKFHLLYSEQQETGTREGIEPIKRSFYLCSLLSYTFFIRKQKGFESAAKSLIKALLL